MGIINENFGSSAHKFKLKQAILVGAIIHKLQLPSDGIYFYKYMHKDGPKAE